MLKILNFFKATTGETKIISMRERFDAAQKEMNAVLAELAEMPSVTIDANARTIAIAAPEQFADEALALPAPEPEEASKTDAEETTEAPETPEEGNKDAVKDETAKEAAA